MLAVARASVCELVRPLVARDTSVARHVMVMNPTFDCTRDLPSLSDTMIVLGAKIPALKAVFRELRVRENVNISVVRVPKLFEHSTACNINEGALQTHR